MIRICMVCKDFIGTKEPLTDKSETHGICQKCFDLQVSEIKKAKLIKSKIIKITKPID